MFKWRPMDSNKSQLSQSGLATIHWPLTLVFQVVSRDPPKGLQIADEHGVIKNEVQSESTVGALDKQCIQCSILSGNWCDKASPLALQPLKNQRNGSPGVARPSSISSGGMWRVQSQNLIDYWDIYGYVVIQYQYMPLYYISYIVVLYCPVMLSFFTFHHFACPNCSRLRARSFYPNDMISRDRSCSNGWFPSLEHFGRIAELSEIKVRFSCAELLKFSHCTMAQSWLHLQWFRWLLEQVPLKLEHVKSDRQDIKSHKLWLFWHRQGTMRCILQEP